jgi:DnaK suppressor protein
MLQDRRNDIQQKLRSLRDALPTEAGDVRDAEEQSLDAFVQEVDFTLMQMKSETLKRIDEAMRRLEDGSYGRCIECSGEIAAARLRALPFAELCRDCQQAIETADSEARDAIVRAAKSAAHGLA